MAYLASIGVSNATIAQPGQSTVKPSDDGRHVARAFSRHANPWWIVILLVIVVLLSLAILARVQASQPEGNAVVTSGGQIGHEGSRSIGPQLGTMKRETPALRAGPAYGPPGELFSAHQGPQCDMEQQTASFQEMLLGDEHVRVSPHVEGHHNDLHELKKSEAATLALQGEHLEEIKSLAPLPREQADAQLNQARRTVGKLVETRLDGLRRSMSQQQQELLRVMNWLVLIGVLGIGLTLIGGIIMQKNIHELKEIAFSQFSETAATTRGEPNPAAGPSGTTEAGRTAMAEDKTDVEPMRPRQVPLPTLNEQMQTIIDAASQLRDVRLKPTIPSAAWGLGLATNKGNVRSENQDYGLCFQIAGHDVLIVADGCGGVPHGQKAAYLAAVSAAVSLVRSCGIASRWHAPRVEDTAAWAIADAAHRLALEGDRLNVTDVRGGLRTTLIVVIGNEHEIGYGYIGDGGGCVVKSSGEVHRFLNPQKASEFAMNVLAASLGPMMEGRPVTGVLKRSPGDLLICGTDGIFDRVEEAFPKDVLRGCIQHNGDLQKTAELIIAELASFQDNAGYVCDDNLTLGIMGDGKSPKLSPGFWLPAGEVVVAPGEPLQQETATQLKEGEP
jgi:serine/threonine protein phosphatase PrpC